MWPRPCSTGIGDRVDAPGCVLNSAHMARFIRSIDPLLPVLEGRPLGIFSDIDGTLAPIVARPENARVSPRNQELLIDLVAAGAQVALITGRTLEVAQGMTGVEGVSYAAIHGLEVSVGGEVSLAPGVEPYTEAARVVLKEVADLKVDGLIVEDKGPIVAFHYRNALNEWTARAGILDAIGKSATAEKFVVQEGRKVVELRPPLEINKGTAVAELAARLGVKSLICLGDDLTDLDMFAAASRLREAGMPVAAVVARSPEVARELMDAADYAVDGVAGVEWLLGELLSALR